MPAYLIREDGGAILLEGGARILLERQPVEITLAATGLSAPVVASIQPTTAPVVRIRAAGAWRADGAKPGLWQAPGDVPVEWQVDPQEAGQWRADATETGEWQVHGADGAWIAPASSAAWQAIADAGIWRSA